jgi:hypothetical protein
LVIDTSENVLMKMLECMEILPGDDGDYYGRFEESHIRSVGTQMKTDAAITDLEQYIERAQEFAWNMPTYLAGRPAIGYPDCPESWHGPFKLISLDQMAADLGTNTQ